MSLHAFLHSEEDCEAISDHEFATADLVCSTIVNPRTRAVIERRARQHNVEMVSLLDPMIATLGKILNQTPLLKPGTQYVVDNSYLDRVRAVDFAMRYDDGLTDEYLSGADVILVGVSRTSKTPTSIYLGYHGIKAANVPLIPGQDPPASLLKAITGGMLTIGLTASPSRLMQVRQTRLRTMGSDQTAGYSDRREIEEELVNAQLFFDRYDLPVIDVTRRSIEETAAAVRQHIRRSTEP